MKINVDPSNKVAELRNILQENEGIDIKFQKEFIYNGKVLDETKTVEESMIHENDLIELVLSLK